jgi:cytochrome c oxidase assembly protein subunit 15
MENPRAGHSTARLVRFERYAWATLVVTLIVIVWGAVVRATGSGAGCGSHWPLCNGAVMPLDPTSETLIEFVHRLTSGAVMVMALALLLWSRRLFGAGHPVRRWAHIAFTFMLIEAAIGAGIVLLELVGDNASVARALYVGGHLVNTLLLVGAQLATLWWIRVRRPITLAAGWSSPAKTYGLALVALLLVASTGAVVALGDTLFPHESLADGLAADLDPTAHFLIRLRVLHPVIAAMTAVWLLVAVAREPVAHPVNHLLVAAVIGQTLLGVINLLLLAPLSLQLSHLLLSNLLWMTVVWRWFEARRLPARL